MLHCKKWSLGYSSGWDNSLPCIVSLYVGERSEREQCCLLNSPPAFSHFPHFLQVDCAASGGWACVHSRFLWAPPTDFLAIPGVSPATATPIGFYSQRFWGFSFPHWDLDLCSLSPQLFLPAYLHTNVGYPSPPAANLLHVLATSASHLCTPPTHKYR